MKKIVVANWKMNPQTLSEARAILAGARKVAKRVRGVDVVVCPPFIYVSLFKIKDSVSFGVQDLFFERAGSFTGEISASMAYDVGVAYAIIGHSERRKMGEDNSLINRKVKAALKENIQTILCIGETVRDLHGRYFKFIEEELLEGLDGVSRNALKKIIIAYEPIWAIGKSSKEAIEPTDMHQMSIFIKKILVKKYGKGALSVPILYGGSVESDNAGMLLSEGRADGFLVGRASLDPKEFGEIIDIANNTK